MLYTLLFDHIANKGQEKTDNVKADRLWLLTVNPGLLPSWTVIVRILLCSSVTSGRCRCPGTQLRRLSSYLYTSSPALPVSTQHAGQRSVTSP